MIFREIVDKLSEHCDIKVISDNIEEEITEVLFMDLRQSNFKSNALYFSNTPREDSFLPQQCIVSAAEEYRDPDTSINLAVVSDRDFGFAFNSAFQMVIDSHRDGYYESMMSTLERVRDVDTLIDIASQTFGASLIFIDRDFRILSYSTQVPVTDKLWMHNIEQGYCDYEFIQNVKSLKSVQAADSTMTPIEVSCTSSPFKKFAARVYCRDIWVGYLIVIENFDSYRTEHVDMLRILSSVVGYAVLKYASNYLYMTSDYHRFIYNLLIGADPSALPETYKSLSFPPDMIVLYCRAMGDYKPFPKEQDLTEDVSAILPGAHVIGRHHSAAVIGSRDILSKAAMILSVFPEECKVKMGVSLPFSDITTLKSHYDEGKDAILAGDILDPDLRLYTFEDYSFYVMLNSLAGSESLNRYVHPAISVLEAYDAENGADLELTLYTYLKCACNTTETAEALFLHRNSVIYRLRRIEELCDVDLNDTDTRFRLRLSFAISNVIGQKRRWSLPKAD